MSYHQAWDTILTEHKPFRCHICPDGTGEFADIACGDPWYRPVVQGEMGSTLIVVRTARGREVLNGAIRTGYVVAARREPNILIRSQNGLLLRRRHVLPKVAALWMLMLPYPRFHGFSLWRSWLRLGFIRKFVSLYRAVRSALGLRRRGPLKLSGGEAVRSATNQADKLVV
jgi:coenzyme F420 hydrogenase subunit beta